ncbi:MAG: dihydroneopterin aldolase [Bdellovibrionales bacterium]|nr:dihydroneopterin aldolase [Bdellovibrionales bacterium]
MQSFVEVKDLIVQTRIGCGPFGDAERANPQHLSITMKAYFDAHPSYTSDDLQDTVNYMELIEIARNLSQEKERHLLETLAFDIAKQIFASIQLVEMIDFHVKKYSTTPECKHVGFSTKFKRDTI